MEEAIEKCETSSKRGIGMFEKFTDLTFKMLNDIRGLELRVDGHGKDISHLTKEIDVLKEIAKDNKETYSLMNDSLTLINKNLCPLLKKNRFLDRLWGWMGWIGTGSVIFTFIVFVVLLVGDTETLIKFITKIT